MVGLVEVVGTGVLLGPAEVVTVVVPFPEGVITAVVELVEVTVVVKVVDPVLLSGEVMKGG